MRPSGTRLGDVRNCDGTWDVFSGGVPWDSQWPTPHPVARALESSRHPPSWRDGATIAQHFNAGSAWDENDRKPRRGD